MLPILLHDREAIEPYLRRNTPLHLYELGDLDDFFWKYTTWYACPAETPVEGLFLIYSGSELPVLLAFEDAPGGPMAELLEAAKPFLPRHFYAHFSLPLAQVFAGDHTLQSHGVHYKMALVDPGRLDGVDTSHVEQLTPADAVALQALYQASYPGNWFDPRMLETGCYFGIWRGAEIVSVAGIHVYSPHYRVATLGNVTTLPALRGQGLGKAACARLCRYLLERVDVVGLNVKVDNVPAIAAYQKLGFEPVAEYEEFDVFSL